MTKEDHFRKNPIIQQYIETLYNELKDETYGVSYSWDELRELSKMIPGENKEKLYYVVSRVNRLLMTNNSMCLVTIPKFGKRILKPNEHALQSRKVVKQAAKKYKSAGAIIAATNMDQLTEDEKLEVITNANKYRTLEMFHNELIKRKEITDKSMTKESQRFFLDFMRLFGNK